MSDRYIDLLVELEMGLETARAKAVAPTAYVDPMAEGEAPYFRSDTQMTLALNQAAMAMWKLVELSTAGLDAKNFEGVELRRWKRSEPNRGAGTGGMRTVGVSPSGASVELASVLMHWDGLMFIEGPKFWYAKPEADAPKVKFRQWLNQKVFRIEAAVDPETWELVPATWPKADGTITASPERLAAGEYAIRDLIKGYRNEVSAHIGGRRSERGQGDAQKLLATAIRDGTFAFRVYTRALLIALGQDLALGLRKLHEDGKEGNRDS